MSRKIAVGQTIVLKIPRELIADCHLSVPKWEALAKSYGYCRDKKRAEKDPNAPKDDKGEPKLPYRSYDYEQCALPYEKHLEGLNLKPEDPWLLVGSRNLGNNLRIIGYDAERGLLELQGENATTSGRKYTCLCRTEKGNLVIDRLQFPEGKPPQPDGISEAISWAASGQELVWSGQPTSIDQIIPYTYDLRHVWDIEGAQVAGMGGRPYAGSLIEEMIDRFMELADGPPEKVAEELTRLADERGYQRERHYLHSAIGLSKDGGDVIIVQRHGAFEDVAETLIQAGAYRAIELDQGGSCSVMMGDPKKECRPWRTLFASHYFRPKGLALLVFSLKKLGEQVFTENSDLVR